MHRRNVQIFSSAFILVIGAGLATVATAVHYHSATRVSDAAAVPTIAPTPLSTPTPSPTPAPTPAAKLAAGHARSNAGTALGAQTTRGASSLGIAAGSSLPSLSNAELGAELDQMRSIGITWLRYDIEWANIEHAGPGQYDWSNYDRITTAAVSRGFKVIGILDYTPAWARLPECATTAVCAPNNPADYGSFAGAATRHYAGLGIHTWEIWNEPNSHNFFQPGADPARYTAMLASAYAQIKGANPSATVITGGLAPADTGGGSYAPIDFLNSIYAQGAHGSFDIVGDHPYSYPFLPSRTNPDSAWGQMKSMRTAMVAHGDAAKQIWITEFGAPTGGPGVGPVSEAVQTQILTDLITQSKPIPWVGLIMWYSFKDAGTTGDTVENFFGLLRADGSAKSAYQTFAGLTSVY